MWKSTPNTPQPNPGTAPTPNAPAVNKEMPKMEVPKPKDNFNAEVAHIGKSVLIKGELSGSEDLYLDGEVEGSIELRDHSLTIGPHGRIRANVSAKDVVVHGKVDGNVSGTERVELKRSAVLVGDIATQRIVIEDGAFFKGAIDIKKEATKPKAPEPARAEPEKAMAAAATPSFTPQASLLEKKY
jgi:cytoskeletal protein CcmA (bactofilin family)